jgi:hypothetical protein
MFTVVTVLLTSNDTCAGGLRSAGQSPTPTEDDTAKGLPLHLMT